MKQFNHKINGFSLIEVLIFISILSLFFVVAAAVTTASLRNMKINEHKILATRYAEELLEWLRSEKEKDSDTFVNSLLYDSTICFNELNWHNDCNDQEIDKIFTRKATIGHPMDKVTISIEVSWSEPGGTYMVPINTVFTVWE